jgi:hypothetical protein
MDIKDALLISAQVAVEAIVDNRDAYAPSTIEAVIITATAHGVSDFYLNMIR